MALGPLCGIEIRLVHLSACDEAGPATSGRPGRGFVHPPCLTRVYERLRACRRPGDGPALGVKDPILCRSHAFPSPARRIRWFGFVRTSRDRFISEASRTAHTDTRVAAAPRAPGGPDEDRGQLRYGVGSRLAGFRLVLKKILNTPATMVNGRFSARRRRPSKYRSR